MIFRLLIITLILLTPAHLFGQQAANETNDTAAQELEAVILEAKKLDHKTAVVSVRSRAAMLVSFSDPLRAQTMFLDVWKFVNDQADDNFDKQQARVVLLKYLFPRDPKLARQLLAQESKPENSQPTNSDDEQQRTGKLASQFIDSDPSLAAALLEKSLSVSSTPAGVGALSRLRERDSFLSDYVAAKALEGLTNQPTAVSLPGISILTAYVFPGPDAPISSIEAESSLESLQFKYFLAGYEVLQASLKETNEALSKDARFSQRDLQVRSICQGQVAAILAALAPRFQPSMAAELSNIAAKLAPQVPANISQITQNAMARLSGKKVTYQDAEQNFIAALTEGDFDEAEKQLDNIKDDQKKKVYSQLLLKNHARALLATADVLGALTLIRKLEDPTARLVMYVDAIKAVKKKTEPDVMNIIINEARLLLPQTDRNGVHLRVLLTFVPQLTNASDDAMEFLGQAVVTINALAKKTNEPGATRTPAEAAMAELNDPYSLLEAPEMEQAFSFVGLRDLDRGLSLARRIEPRAVQLVARLEAIQGIIKRPSSKPKVTPKPPKR